MNNREPAPAQRSSAREVRPIRRDGRFFNPWPGSEPAGFRDFLKWQLGRRIRQEVVAGPEWPRFELATPTIAMPRAHPGELLATWVGHSTVLLQIGSLNVLTDPMWSPRASPLSFAGPRRMVPPGVELEALPPLDIVLLSHNHYDHLDVATIGLLAAHSPDAQWVVPLALGGLVARHGAGRVHQLDWWEERVIGDARIAGTPAQHFSARSLGDRGRTLWCGWSIEAGGRRVFFAGDTAYHPAFPAIAERFGPFDLTLMPIGAYEPRWFMRSVHMNPEEAVHAHVELSVEGHAPGAMLPIHWGTFRLTDEPPGEPPLRVREAWKAARLPDESLWLLRHGETRRLAGAEVRERSG